MSHEAEHVPDLGQPAEVQAELLVDRRRATSEICVSLAVVPARTTVVDLAQPAARLSLRPVPLPPRFEFCTVGHLESGH